MPAAYKFTPEQEARLRGPEGNEALAQAFGCTSRTIYTRRKKLGISCSTNTPVPQAAEQGGELEQDIALLKHENAELRKIVRKGSRTDLGDERVLRAIEQAIERVEPVAVRRYIARAPVKVTGDAHHRQILLLSDLHYGETVDKEQMNGLNEYSTFIAEERAGAIVQSALKFQAVRPELSGLDVWCLGDMASGAIHALEETNEVPAAEQFVRAGHLIGSMVEQLAPHYPEVRCAGIVGNHPRPNAQPASANAHNNGDWVSYHIAKAANSALANVDWEIPTGAQLVREVAGLKFLLWHGDGVRSSMPGVPWGGVMRRWNELKSTYAAQGTLLDYVVVGHFHQACVVPGVFMNGSVVGPNAYGLKNFGGGQRATQLLITVDERKSRVTDVCYLTPS
jgi:predicted phosphodiesterase